MPTKITTTTTKTTTRTETTTAGGGKAPQTKTALNAAEETTIAEEQVEENSKDAEPSEAELITAQEAARDLRYPLDLNSGDHPGYIEFESFVVEGLNISEKLSNAFSSIDLSRNSFRKKDNDTNESSASQELTDKEKEQLSELSQVSERLATFENLEGGTPNGKVTLPLSAGLNFNDNAVYQNADLGLIAGALETASGAEGKFTLSDGNLSAAGAALAAQKLSGLAGEALGGAAGLLAGRGNRLLAGGVGAIAGADLLNQLPNALASATRFAPAPNERVLFKRMNIRKFSFQFKMVAFSEAEAKEIKNIITFFRTEMYPEQVNLTTGGDLPLALKFPNVFDIRIKNRKGNNPAYKIQRCYLESVATTFNATSPTMYRGEYFMEVDIGLSFSEIGALNKQRVRDGY